MNIVVLKGNLTSDPVTHVTKNGKTVSKFSLAVNEQNKTVYVDVTAFGKTAETITKFHKKGSPFLMQGRLNFESWESDGKKRQKISVICDRFEFCGQKVDKKEPAVSPTYMNEDELPF